MKLNRRVSVALISVLIGMAWSFMPSPIGGQGPTCAKPPGAHCGSKTIQVFADGLHGHDDEISYAAAIQWTGSWFTPEEG